MGYFQIGDRVIVSTFRNLPSGTVLQECDIPYVKMDNENYNCTTYKEQSCTSYRTNQLIYEPECGIKLFEGLGFVKLHNMGRSELTLYINDNLLLEYIPESGMVRMVVINENYDYNISVGNFMCYLDLPHIKTIEQVKQLYTTLTGEIL